MIGQINKVINQSAAEIDRVYRVPHFLQPQKLGVYFFYEQQEIKAFKASTNTSHFTFDMWETKRKEIRNRWAAMTGGEKAEVERKKINTQSLKSNRQSRHTSRPSAEPSGPVLTSPYRIGSTDRPIADAVVDRLTAVNSIPTNE